MFIILLILVIIVIFLVAQKNRDSDQKISRKHVHDIRGSLANIKTRSEVAMLNPNLNTEIKDILKNNIQEVDKASKILNELLN